MVVEMGRRINGNGLWVCLGLMFVELGIGPAACAGAQSPPQERAANGATPLQQASANDTDPVRWEVWEGEEPWPEELVEVEGLPQPPAELAQLVELGQVEFRFYDAEKWPRRFTGETRLALRYHLSYSYQARVTGSGRRRRLIVKLEHQPTKFVYRHQVLLPLRLVGDSLYTAPLVLHELDHVKIGIDPRYPALFDQWFVEKTETLNLAWRADSRQEDVEKLVQEAVQTEAAKCFDKLLQLIKVRQRDLDRVTRHGLEPLPIDFFSTPPTTTAADQR